MLSLPLMLSLAVLEAEQNLPGPKPWHMAKPGAKALAQHRAAVQGTQQAPVTWLEAFVQQWVFKVQWQC